MKYRWRHRKVRPLPGRFSPDEWWGIVNNGPPCNVWGFLWPSGGYYGHGSLSNWDFKIWTWPWYNMGSASNSVAQCWILIQKNFFKIVPLHEYFSDGHRSYIGVTALTRRVNPRCQICHTTLGWWDISQKVVKMAKMAIFGIFWHFWVSINPLLYKPTRYISPTMCGGEFPRLGLVITALQDVIYGLKNA